MAGGREEASWKETTSDHWWGCCRRLRVFRGRNVVALGWVIRFISQFWRRGPSFSSSNRAIACSATKVGESKYKHNAAYFYAR
ncbi:hypothetical protein NDN08_003169 [Rhodosorus marinus]|uniref:Uncharacterized protein n=1 Tax=Rhodosorus marinus TaxID=101924 RepID=A0AAV8UVW1_9RHOD|nr:hypothetical protein NDN08_003169 [Rhodosorus marinus]